MNSFLGYSDYAPLTSSKNPTRGFVTRVRHQRDRVDSFDAFEMAKLTRLSDSQTRAAIAALIKVGELVAEPVQRRRYRWVSK